MCEFMFKFNSSLLPVNFNNFFQEHSSVHHYDTRQKMITIVFTPELEHARLLLDSGDHLNGKITVKCQIV